MSRLSTIETHRPKSSRPPPKPSNPAGFLPQPHSTLGASNAGDDSIPRHQRSSAPFATIQYALSTSRTNPMASGDTVMIEGGTYVLGTGGNNTAGILLPALSNITIENYNTTPRFYITRAPVRHQRLDPARAARHLFHPLHWKCAAGLFRLQRLQWNQPGSPCPGRLLRRAVTTASATRSPGPEPSPRPVLRQRNHPLRSPEQRRHANFGPDLRQQSKRRRTDVRRRR